MSKRDVLVIVLLSYIGLCLGLGGSGLNWFRAHGVLQATAAAGIAILIATWPRKRLLGATRIPITLISIMTLIALIQCVPLPVFVWTILPGRDTIVEGFQSLGISLVALPTSLDVEATISSLGYALTPLFVLLLSARIGMQRLKLTAPVFLCALGYLSVTLGLLQVFSGRSETLYLYQNPTTGLPAGTFSNVNHFGTLMLMVLPFAILLTRKSLSNEYHLDLRIALIIGLCTLLFFLFVGVGATGSVAVYILFVPCVALAVWGTRARGHEGSMGLIVGALGCLVCSIGIALISTSPVLSDLGMMGDPESPTSRLSIWSYTGDAIQEYWPVGTGMGTYLSVISQFEDPETVLPTYVALAHNEYLQISLEFGLPGALALAVALGWLLVQARSIWASNETGETQTVRKMAYIGVLVCVLHSLIDYPVRTPGIASLLALFVALIALPRVHQEANEEVNSDSSKRLVL